MKEKPTNWSRQIGRIYTCVVCGRRKTMTENWLKKCPKCKKIKYKL